MTASTICHLQFLVADVFRVHVFISEIHVWGLRAGPPFCQMRNRRRNQGKQHNRTQLDETVFEKLLNACVYKEGLKV